MLCPKCKVEMRAEASYHIEGKKLFLWQQFFCRNRQCENYGQPVKTILHEIPVEKEEYGMAKLNIPNTRRNLLAAPKSLP